MSVEGAQPKEPPRVGERVQSPVDFLIDEIETYSLGALEEPTYARTPTIEEYVADCYPKAVQKLQEGGKLGRWRRGQIRRAEEGYPGKVQAINAQNDKGNTDWRAKVAFSYTRNCAVALLAGEEDAATSYYSQAETWGGTPRMSWSIGLALLAKDQPDRGKRILLAQKKINPFQVHNLFDAYRFTGDEEYRAAFLNALPENHPYLIGRLLLHDQAAGRDTQDLFRMAGGKGSKMAVALLQLANNSEEGTGPYDAFLKRTLPEYAPPAKKTMGTTDRMKRHVKKDGLYGVLDAATLGLEALVDGERRVTTPEYSEWADNQAITLSELAPLLSTYEGYRQPWMDRAIAWEGYGSDVLLSRSNWGDQAAGGRLLEQRRAADKLLVYRNVLRDFGPTTGMQYLPNIPARDRQQALFCTLLAFAMQGQTPERIPDLPEAQDNYRGLQALYERATELAPDAGAVGAGDVSDIQKPLPSQQSLAIEAELSQLSLLDEAGRQAVLNRLRSLNDPDHERALLKQVLDRKTSNPDA